MPVPVTAPRRRCAAYLVVDNNTAMLVDASTRTIAPKVLAKLAEAGAELKLIVLTHYHYDHVGAADTLRDATGARVAIHRLDADALRHGGKLRVNPTRLQARILAPFITRGDKAPVIPDLEFGDDEDLQQHGGFGRSLWTPGHTAGSQCVLLPDGTVLAGDALTEGILPPHSAAGPLFAEDSDASRSSIVAIASAANGKVSVAHRGWLDPRSLKNWQHEPDPARGRDSLSWPPSQRGQPGLTQPGPSSHKRLRSGWSQRSLAVHWLGVSRVIRPHSVVAPGSAGRPPSRSSGPAGAARNGYAGHGAPGRRRSAERAQPTCPHLDLPCA